MVIVERRKPLDGQTGLPTGSGPAGACPPPSPSSRPSQPPGQGKKSLDGFNTLSGNGFEDLRPDDKPNPSRSDLTSIGLELKVYSSRYGSFTIRIVVSDTHVTSLKSCSVFGSVRTQRGSIQMAFSQSFK